MSDNGKQLLPRLRCPAWSGLALLLALWLPLTVWRAQLESNFWIDETYSVMLTTYPVSRLVELTAADAHPPGYYLALKVWLKTGRLLGFEPGIRWARSLNVACWVFLAVAAWFGGRRLFGTRGGTIFAWTVAGSAYPALVARDLRSYGVATVALLVSFLVLLLLVRRHDHAPTHGGRTLLLWAAYAVAAGVALWTHLLSTIALGLLLLLWIGVFVRRRHLTPAFAWGGLAANLVAVMGFLPWLAMIGRQLGYLQRSAPDWMTPPTVANLFRVFTFWYPFSRIGDPTSEGNGLLVPLGIVAVCLPLAAALWAASRGSEQGNGSFAGRAAVLAMAAAFGFVTVLWGLHRFGFTYTFHGPRYPALTANLWAAGLGLLAVFSVGRLRAGRGLAVALVAPWLISSALAQWILVGREAQWGLANWEGRLAGLFPEPGAAIYVMPSELIPFYRRSLAKYTIRRIDDLPCDGKAMANATVVNVNFWSGLDRPRDHLLRHLIESSSAAEHVARKGFPERQKDYTMYRIEGIRSEFMAELCETGVSSKAERTLAGAASKALPEDQVAGAQWSFLEMRPDLETSRWATAQSTPVVFDQALAAGDYILHLSGYRSPYPREPLTMRLSLDDETPHFEEPVRNGMFHLRFPVHLRNAHHRPVVVVEHDTWRPADYYTSNDRRTLAFLLLAGWFEHRNTVPEAPRVE
ncbi:MAG: hypothetical protein GY856_41170 [bacterium]|nr:hypothetical protein [bacterium]